MSCHALPGGQIWLWVNNGCPCKWSQGLKPAVPWRLNFDPYPYVKSYCSTHCILLGCPQAAFSDLLQPTLAVEEGTLGYARGSLCSGYPIGIMD